MAKSNVKLHAADVAWKKSRNTKCLATEAEDFIPYGFIKNQPLTCSKNKEKS